MSREKALAKRKGDRNELFQAYADLRPFERFLMQLCSVIYEPAGRKDVCECFKNTGVVFSGTPVTSVGSLEAPLKRLRDTGLLDEHCRCHPAVIEMITREALREKRILKLGDNLEDMDSLSAWATDPPSEGRCETCGSISEGPFLKAPAGRMCVPCVLNELHCAADAEELEAWSAPRIVEALSPEGGLYERFVVLFQFSLAENIVLDRTPSRLSRFLELLLANLDCPDDHPLAVPLRREALAVCEERRSSLIPFLSSELGKRALGDSEKVFGTLVDILARTMSWNRSDEEILNRAAHDQREQIRAQLASSLGGRSDQRSLKMLKTLAKDADESVRRRARESLKTNVRPPSNLSLRHVINAPLPPSHFGPIVEAVWKVRPPQHTLINPDSCARGMRDLRIGLYTGYPKIYNHYYRQLEHHCREECFNPDPLTGMCANPFDGKWFATLSPNLQIAILARIFYDTLTTLEPDDEPLAYALEPDFADSLPESHRFTFIYHLVCRLMMGGRLGEARRFVHKEADRGDFDYGLKASIWLLEGRRGEARRQFDADLKQLRRMSGKKDDFFTGLSGVLYVLAHLTMEEPPTKKIRKLVDCACSDPHRYLYYRSFCTAVQAISHVLDNEPDKARSVLNAYGESEEGMGAYLLALAELWIDNTLSLQRVDALSRAFTRAREIGLKWLAMEAAELLCMTEDRTPVRQKAIEAIQSETGMRSLTPLLNIEEHWRRNLRALIEVTSREGAGKGGVDGKRLAWFIGLYQDSISLLPREQKLSKKGQWTIGRTISLARLYKKQGPECLTRQDQRICNAIEEVSHYRYRTRDRYYFDLNRALPALAGHPLVFLEGSASTHLDVVEGEPEVTVTRSDSTFHMEFFPKTDPKGSDQVTVVQETPTRLKVIQILESHRRIADLLGENGLKVPLSAREKVLEVISGLSSLVTVHSAVGGKSEDILEVPSSATPHVHLLPAGSGFRMEMFVKPFESGGPYLKPGVGAENVIAEIEGRKLQTHRDLALEEDNARQVEASCSLLSAFPDSERRWLLEDPDDCLQALLDLQSLHQEGKVAVEWPEGEKIKITREASFEDLRLQIRSRGDWFELNGRLGLDENMVMDMEELLGRVRESGSRFVPMGDGHFLALTNELRKRLQELDAYSEKSRGQTRVHPLAALALEDLTTRVPHLETDPEWERRLQRIKECRDYEPPVPSTLKAELRDYQVEGYRWLARLAEMGMGACLADDMGLGKTVQALAVILHRASQGPTLVVAPTSVCMNWVSEANRFAPTLAATFFGSGSRQELVQNLKPFDMLVVSYGLLLQESELLQSVQWQTIVLDEAQAIKNVTTKRARAAMKLKGDFKLITTGTPVENRLSEVWTLFNFINPGLLGSYKGFNERFAAPIEKHNDRYARRRLKKLVRPFILRRIKSQVLEELPQRTEVTLQVEMSPEEAAFYEALRRGAVEKLEKDSGPESQKHLKILAEIMRLRRACCNPRLIAPESQIQSSKLQLFGEILSELRENRHKALVFSQFVGHLSLIREYLDSLGIAYCYVDGSTPVAERNRQVEAFQGGKGDLFLISLRAGGQGLNLTAASYVIHMDPWWNPAVEDQASDRVHRIGQQHPVTIYRLVTQNTIEEKIMSLHQEKRDLADSLLEGTDTEAKISAEELMALIREQ